MAEVVGQVAQKFPKHKVSVFWVTWLHPLQDSDADLGFPVLAGEREGWPTEAFNHSSLFEIGSMIVLKPGMEIVRNDWVTYDPVEIETEIVAILP